MNRENIFESVFKRKLFTINIPWLKYTYFENWAIFCHLSFLSFDDFSFFVMCTWSYELPYYGKTLALPQDDLLHFQIEGFELWDSDFTVHKGKLSVPWYKLGVLLVHCKLSRRKIDQRYDEDDDGIDMSKQGRKGWKHIVEVGRHL